jgi:hypothetical protein
MEDAKRLVRYWHEKSHIVLTIYQKLCESIGQTCLAYSTVTDSIRKLNKKEDMTQRASGSECLPENASMFQLRMPLSQPLSFSAFTLLSRQVALHISLEAPAFRRSWYSRFTSCSPHAVSGSKAADGGDSDRIKKNCRDQPNSELGTMP